MDEIFVFKIKTNDGNMFREYVENIWQISEAVALKRFEKAIKKHEYFYLKDSGRYI
ncbi:alcohol dehydrogenase YqhD (iron-dependent ADH family) [Staphylococcus cohnii]